jgi:peptide/nickel transport system permease protein
MRLVEALLSIPFLILALLAVSMAGPGLQGTPALLILVLAVVYLPRIARMSRAAALEVVTRDHVLAARLRGESTLGILWREVLPNASGVLLVEFAVRAGYAPVLVGTLGFLGFGLRPPSPEWGLMMAEYRNLLTTQPMAVFGPGLMLASLVVGLSFLTEGLSARFGQTSARGSA